MSSSTVIHVNNLSKHYLLNKGADLKSDTLYGSFINNLKNLKNIARKKETSDFWALNDVSFKIEKGDRVGIIGRNGAGKSTLLKVLSRITPPTKGRIEITGRVASLLEVGTGFHGDLSGRENIYLNGSILGMTKKEIDRKFDEIVDFSEVEKFIDTPVKRYSSGMYVRLAFAVAANLEPDILIVDEVLAVGDAQFQRKCLGKMEEVSTQEGRTILFVSHNMAAIQNLCDKCLYLKNGEVIAFGRTEEVIPEYLRATQQTKLLSLNNRIDRSGNGKLRFNSLMLKNKANESLAAAQCGEYLNFEIETEAFTDLTNVLISLGIDDDYGQRIASFSNEVTDQMYGRIAKGIATFQIRVPKLPLKGGTYTFTLFCTVNADIADWIQEAGSFEVEAGDFFNTGKLPPEGQGSIFIEHTFNLK